MEQQPSNYRRNFMELRNAINNLVHDAIEDSWSTFESWELPERMGNLVDHARGEINEYMGNVFPKVDIRENGESLVLEADLPGVDPEDLEIEVGEDSILLAGIAGYESEETDEAQMYYSFERHYGTFEREILLPTYVDPDAAVGEIKNGTLTLTLPKLAIEEPKKMTKKKSTTTKKKSPVKKASPKKKSGAVTTKKKAPGKKKAAPAKSKKSTTKKKTTKK